MICEGPRAALGNTTFLGETGDKLCHNGVIKLKNEVVKTLPAPGETALCGCLKILNTAFESTNARGCDCVSCDRRR